MCLPASIQTSEDNQFLFETKVDSGVQSTVKSIVHIYNLRQKIHRLKLEGEELAKFGPAKQLEKQGIDTYAEENVDKGEYYTMDPTGRRTGNGSLDLPEFADDKYLRIGHSTMANCP